MREHTQEPGQTVRKPDIPKIKMRAGFAAKNYNRLGSSWAEFYGRDVPQLVTELEEAQGKLNAVKEWLEPSGVAQHPEVTKARNELRARILKEEK